jgi:PAS domain S-box-containing protein
MDHLMTAASEAFALIDIDGRVMRANLAYRRLTGPASGAHDASIVSFLEPERQEMGRDLLRGICAETPVRQAQLRFKIGRDFRRIDAAFTWLGPDGLIAFIGKDVTEVDHAQREKVRRDADRDALEAVAPVGHWSLTPDRRLVSSPGTARILGIDPDAPPLTSSDIRGMILERDRATIAEAAKAAMDRRKPMNVTISIRRADGEIRHIQVTGGAFSEREGATESFHGVIIDKTDQLATLRAAMAEDKLLFQTVSASPTGLAMLDREMRILVASASFLAAHNVREEEALGHCLYDIAPHLPDRWRHAYRQALRGEFVRNDCDKVELGNGKRIWVRWTCYPWRDANDEIGGVLISREDITASVEERLAIESSKERMEFGLSMSLAMVIELDFENRAIHSEGAWQELFPQKPTFDAITGVAPWIHHADRERMAEHWRAHLAGGAPYTVEYRVNLSDDRQIWHLASIRILKTVKGSPSRAFAVVQDITERKRIEEQALRAEQKAIAAGVAKSDFLSNMSHEIRTPLNGVLAVSEMLGRTSLDHKQQEMVRLIGSSGTTLLRVMDDLVEFSRLEADQIAFDVRPFELETTLRQACDAAKSRVEAKGLAFESFISASLDGVFRGDPLRISQVLGNLLNNAVKFTHEGKISVHATAEESDGRTLMRMTVTDTGIGFSEEVGARIFDRFEQGDGSNSRKYGGLGIGLSIVKRIVDMMGGTVTARSVEGEGSVFEVVLPLSRDRISALGSFSAVAIEDFEAETKVENIRLLVAEDNPMNRRVVELLLAQSDVQIQFAENGQEAVENFRKGSFDLVLMDLQMPIMGGLAATRAIREWERAGNRAATPILALSANATDDHVREAIEAGADGHVAKPIVREVLFEAITRHATPGGGSKASDDFEFDLDDLDVAV